MKYKLIYKAKHKGVWKRAELWFDKGAKRQRRFEMKKEKQIIKKCYNCKHASKSFKIAGMTHLHCLHPKYTKEDFKKGKFSEYDTLMEFWNTCEDFEPKEKGRAK